MIIRKATQEDREALCRIQTQAIRKAATSHYSREQIEAWSGGLTPEYYSEPVEHSIVFVAEDTDGTVVGFARLVEESGEVAAIYVDPDHTGHGIGRQLIEALEEEARRVGVRELNVKASLNAVAFYERVGFKFEREALHRFRSGVEIPCVIMKKPLLRGKTRMNVDESD